MHEPPSSQFSAPGCRWNTRDSVAAVLLFMASAAVVLWQNARLTVLWDTSYILDTSARIAAGQVPYRDFPLAHAPLTFLIQAAIIRIFGRVYLHHVVYAAVVNGLGTLLAWRIALRTLRGRMARAWTLSVALAAPLSVLGVYSILPFPSYDCDCAVAILAAVFLLQRVNGPAETTQRWFTRKLMQAFAAGAVLPLPVFFKQNIGLPFLLAAIAVVCLLLVEELARGRRKQSLCGNLTAILAGSFCSVIAAMLVLHWTAGIGNYVHWTIQFAAQRRMPGLREMAGVYAEPALLWWLPCIAAGIALTLSRWRGTRWARLASWLLLAAPFLWTLCNLSLLDDADDRADSLLALWPLLLVLAAVAAAYNLMRRRSLSGLLPLVLLAAIHGALLSQQLWGSTYAIWPLLVLLVAEALALLPAGSSSSTGVTATAQHQPFVPALAVTFAVTLLVCGGLYMASAERLSYAEALDGDAHHSAIPALKGITVRGPFLPEFEELLDFAAKNIPRGDGLILIPGEDPFYFATGRTPQFPVLLFDPATQPYSPEQLAEQARIHNIRWLIVKRELQLKADPTPQREAALAALQREFAPYRSLDDYDVYRRAE